MLGLFIATILGFAAGVVVTAVFGGHNKKKLAAIKTFVNAQYLNASDEGKKLLEKVKDHTN